MKSVKTLVSGLTASLALNDSHKQIVAGIESSDATVQQHSQAKLSQVQTAVENFFSKINTSLSGATPGVEDANIEAIKTLAGDVEQITQVQIDAAQQVAMHAIDPLASIKNLSRARAGFESGVVTFNTRGLEPMSVDASTIMAGIEGFDNTDLSASVYFSIIFQTFAVKQDAVVELFMPMVIQDPNKVGFEVSTKVVSIMDAVKRDISGRPTKFDQKSLLKNLDDTSLFTLEANKLYPILRTESRPNLFIPVVDDNEVSGFVRTKTVGAGEEVEIAPIKISTEVDLLGISQPAELVTKGLMDQTDTLNSYLTVDELFFEIVGKDSSADDAADVIEYYNHEIVGIPATFFGGNATDTDSKDMSLSYETKSIALKAGSIVTIDGKETSNYLLKDITDGYTVKIGVKIKGDANIETGKYEVYPAGSEGLRLIAVLDAAGNEVSETNTNYINAKAAIEGMTLKATLPGAYAANDNGRFKSRKLTSNTKTYGYTTQTRFVIREEVSVNGGEDAGLAGQIQYTQQVLNKFGLLELNKTAALLGNTSIDAAEFGVTDDLFSKGYVNEDIDLMNIVDGERSSTRIEDITDALKLQIRNTVNELNRQSGYLRVFKTVYPNSKPTVAIGIDSDYGMYLDNWSDNVYNYVVETSADSLVEGKMFIGFTVFDKQRNKVPNPMGFGVTSWSPETVLAGKSKDSNFVEETLIAPRFRHQVLQQILGVHTLSNLDAVVGKIARLTKSV